MPPAKPNSSDSTTRNFFRAVHIRMNGLRPRPLSLMLGRRDVGLARRSAALTDQTVSWSSGFSSSWAPDAFRFFVSIQVEQPCCLGASHQANANRSPRPYCRRNPLARKRAHFQRPAPRVQVRRWLIYWRAKWIWARYRLWSQDLWSGLVNSRHTPSSAPTISRHSRDLHCLSDQTQ